MKKEKGIMSNKKKIIIGIVSLIFILSIVAVIMMTTGGDSNEPKDDVQANADITMAPITVPNGDGTQDNTSDPIATEDATLEPTATPK